MRVQWSSGRGFHQLPPRLQIRSTACPSLLRTLRTPGYDQTPEHGTRRHLVHIGTQWDRKHRTPQHASGHHVKGVTHWFRVVPQQRLTLMLGFDLHCSRAAATLRPAGPAPTTATSSISKVLHASRPCLLAVCLRACSLSLPCEMQYEVKFVIITGEGGVVLDPGWQVHIALTHGPNGGTAQFVFHHTMCMHVVQASCIIRCVWNFTLLGSSMSNTEATVLTSHTQVNIIFVLPRGTNILQRG